MRTLIFDTDLALSFQKTKVNYPLMEPKPFIIPIFLPHAGCPHRCIFCDQSAITGRKAAAQQPDKIRQEIRNLLQFSNGRRTPVQISFYGGNFLGQSEKTVRRLLDTAAEFIRPGQVDSIRFSTRPDTVNRKRLGWLSGYRVATVELGAQSMDDTVLKEANRGHTSRDTRDAMVRLKDAGYETGLQMMIGLPGDTAAGALATGRRLQGLAPDFVRIYPTLVLRGSRLAARLEAGRYTPLSLDAAVELTGRLYRLFVFGGTRVIRMGLQASGALNHTDTLLAGPYHPAFGHLVMSRLFLDGVCRALKVADRVPHTISIAVNPRSVSNLKGQKNRNLELIKRRFSIREVAVLPEPALGQSVVVVNAGNPVSILNQGGPS